MPPSHGSQSSILRISDEKTLQLVVLYGQEPCLWDSTHTHYKNKESRAAAARRIATLLEVDHFEARHVMIKFKNLRNSYCQELKKIAACLDKGLSGQQLYQPKVAWFQHMDAYLRPHLQPSRTKTIVEQLNVPRASCRTVQVKEELGDSDCSHNDDFNHNDDWICLTDEEHEREDHGADNKRARVESPSIPGVTIGNQSGRYSDLASNQTGLHNAVDSNHSGPYIDPASNQRGINSASPANQTSVAGNHSGLCNASNQSASHSMTDCLLQTISANLQTISRQRDDQFESFGRYVASVLRALPGPKARSLQPKIVHLITAGLDTDEHHDGDASPASDL